MKPLRNILRIQSRKTRQYSWVVRIVRASPKVSFSQSFSDKKYGGKKAALKAALACRDQKLKAYPLINSKLRSIGVTTASNKSGITGVRRGMKVIKRGKKKWEYPAWIATGTPISGGKSKTCYFVFDVHGGSRAAKALAIKQRQEWEKSLRKSLRKLAALQQS
jgi:hypothetical protein